MVSEGVEVVLSIVRAAVFVLCLCEPVAFFRCRELTAQPSCSRPTVQIVQIARS